MSNSKVIDHSKRLRRKEWLEKNKETLKVASPEEREALLSIFDVYDNRDNAVITVTGEGGEKWISAQNVR